MRFCEHGECIWVLDENYEHAIALFNKEQISYDYLKNQDVVRMSSGIGLVLLFDSKYDTWEMMTE